jgi:hypothetical protein
MNKISVLVLYLRLINIFNNRNLLWAIRVTLGFTIAFVTTWTIIPLAKCTPFEANWRSYDPNYRTPHKCISDRLTLPVAAGLSAASDLVAVIIPLVILAGSPKPLKQKVGLYSVFAVGSMYGLSISVKQVVTAANWCHVQRRWSRNSTHSSYGPNATASCRFHMYVFTQLLFTNPKSRSNRN